MAHKNMGLLPFGSAQPQAGTGLSKSGLVFSLSTPVSIANGGTNNTASYTSGSIIFSDGSKVTENNSKLFWDNTNNRLGVGIASPAADLHISTANSTNIEVDSSNTGSTGIVLNNTSTGGKNLSFFSTGSANGFGAGQFGVYNNTDNKSLMLAYGATGNFRYLQGANLGWGDAQFALSADTGIARNGAGIVEVNNGTNGTYRDLQIRSLLQSGKITNYNNIATAGWGHPAIYGQGRATAQTAAASSVAAYTVGASDGSFIISANILVTASTTHSFSVECAYTDEGNTARTVTFNVQQLGGTLITSITNVTGVGPYEGVPLHIRAKANTSITIRTNSGGTYTAVTYNVEGVIQQIA